MKPQLDVLQVLQRTSQMLRTGTAGLEPAWYKAVLETPPTTELNSKLTVKHLERAQKLKKKNFKVRDLFKPQKIVFPEDSIRTTFYTQHPWELARPKILVENDALEFTKSDWSKIEQHNKQLDGESVVQRTMWLKKKGNMRTTAAYKQALQEFYKARIYRQVAKETVLEEAKMFGAVFFPGKVEAGLAEEAKYLYKFKEDVVTKYARSEQTRDKKQDE
ncbi:mitochondrial ribosomal protein S25 [Myxozyma melibiosi]|uniref:Small ribosomal subunit protein mS23 n=1 Tax=Myxozyma melibiosi TaxID=54550 RepID=A0ABR1F7G9_9ASCO